MISRGTGWLVSAIECSAARLEAVFATAEVRRRAIVRRELRIRAD